MDDALWVRAERVLADFDPPAKFGPDRIEQHKAPDGAIYRMPAPNHAFSIVRPATSRLGSANAVFDRWQRRNASAPACALRALPASPPQCQASPAAGVAITLFWLAAVGARLAS